MGVRRTQRDGASILRRARLGTMDHAGQLLEVATKYSIQTCPLDVEKLAAVLGIEIVKIDLGKDKSGSLHKDDLGRWIISVNNKHHPTRQRFTIAHELAHHALHREQIIRHEDNIIFRSDETNQMESEANRFAGELLMPKSFFIEFIKTRSASVDDIAAYFNVSPLAVRVRAKQLGLIEEGR